MSSSCTYSVSQICPRLYWDRVNQLYTYVSYYAWCCSVFSFFFFNWLHIICYKFWFCNDESPHCLLHPPFSMLQDRFKFSHCLLTSSQFVFIFWDAALKCTALSLQIELFYMYGKVTTPLFFLFVLIFLERLLFLRISNQHVSHKCFFHIQGYGVIWSHLPVFTQLGQKNIYFAVVQPQQIPHLRLLGTPITLNELIAQ